MNYIACAQGSAEWFEAHIGRASASGMAKILAVLKRKDGEAAIRYNYKMEKLAEICTGKVSDHFVSDAMVFGTENEPFARAAYEIANDVSVEECGFFVHPRIDRFIASPDGIVDADGLLECKAPNTTTHLEWTIAGVIPEEHLPQMVAQLACAPGRKWNQFVSFDPRLPKHLQLFQPPRLMRDDARIAEYEQAVEQFLGELDALMLRLPTAGSAEFVDEEIFAEPKCKTGCNAPAVLHGYCDHCNELRDENLRGDAWEATQ